MTDKAVSDLNFKPTTGMASEARKGLEWRKEFKRRNRKYPTGELIKKIIDTTNIDSTTEYLDGDVFL